MDVERALISRVVTDQQIQLAISRGIESQHFIGKPIEGEPAPGDVWEWLVVHKRRYRGVPSVQLFKARWPGFIVFDVSDSLEAVVDQFVRVVKRRSLIDTIRSLSVIADDWAMVGEAETHLFEAARDLAQLVPVGEVHRFSDSLSRLELYNARKELGHVPGVSTLIQEIDDMTYGIQRKEMLIIEGFLNIGKSSLGIGMAANSYFNHNQTPLVLSLEMDGDKMANRWDAYAAKIKYDAIKRMELSPAEEARWYDIALKADQAKLEKDIVVIDNLYRPSIERVLVEIERWNPEWTMVDTIDEINAPSQYRSSYERQGFAARELKGVARHTNSAIVAMAQAGRDAEEDGARLSNMANSIDIARKADVVVGLHATEQMQKAKKMEIRLLKTRDSSGKGFHVDYFWDVETMTFRRWQPQDAMSTQPNG